MRSVEVNCVKYFFILIIVSPRKKKMSYLQFDGPQRICAGKINGL